MPLLAHSARFGSPEQTYADHVTNVVRAACENAENAAAYKRSGALDFTAAVEMAAHYHDLGKLDNLFQEDLAKNAKRTRIHHSDAGAAYLLQIKQIEAAILGYSHHIGLQNLPAESAKNANGIKGMFRDFSDDKPGNGKTAYEHTDDNLPNYLKAHHQLIPEVAKSAKTGFTALERRLALSCLVDGDHGDTAKHYGNEIEITAPTLLAEERLNALNRYVEELAAAAPANSEKEIQRQHLRQSLYTASRDRGLPDGSQLVACDSPVGTGKTTAVMAHLLRVAHARRLRRIFVVLPYTNVIDQSVEVYRKALVLPGEQPEQIVAAHHHRVEFDGENALELRLLSQLWEAPIIVTTAVQFFETLAACGTSALRKFHQLPGAAVFVDETHAAMSAPLWPQMFRWLQELCHGWSCHVVLASGSLARFWNMPEFFPEGCPAEIPDLVEDSALRELALRQETNRVSLRTEPKAKSIDELADFVLTAAGPILVILNTVQSAAVFALHLREKFALGENVEHLSTALAPLDRVETLERVRNRLKDKNASPNWVLVATSCVEAGVDFSFRTAFRESCSIVNLLQIAGRANRGDEFPDAEVWDFQHDGCNLLSLHPAFKLSRQVLRDMFQRHAVTPDSAACGEALRLEISSDYGSSESQAGLIASSEQQHKYKDVSKLCRLIVADTRTVIIDQTIADRIRSVDRNQFPNRKEMMNSSVQLWASKLDAKKWPAEELPCGNDLWAWLGEYDKFIGYMAGVIPLLKAGVSGLDPI